MAQVIKILGTGCPKCKKTEQVVKQVVVELGTDAEIIKLEDIQDIMAYDVMRTPAVVIDEKVVFSGRVPSVLDVKILLQS